MLGRFLLDNASSPRYRLGLEIALACSSSIARYPWFRKRAMVATLLEAYTLNDLDGLELFWNDSCPQRPLCRVLADLHEPLRVTFYTVEGDTRTISL